MTTSIFGAGALVNVDVNGSLIPQSFVGTAGQTLYNITAFSYTPGTNSLLVFINGQKQVSGRDFQETSSTSFTLNEGVVAGDYVDVIGFPQIINAGLFPSSSVLFTQRGSTFASNLNAKMQQYQFINVMDYGAIGDGVADDGPAFNLAFTQSKFVSAAGGNFKISTPVVLPAGFFLNLSGTNLILNTPGLNAFQILNANAGGYVLHGGGVITGTAASCFFLQGTTNVPVAQGQYASNIHFEAVMISSVNITTSFVFDKAVKSIYINGGNFFTPNGCSASGKCVEIYWSNCILFSATGAVGTFGIKLRSTGGTTFYNEGWVFTNCTIDNYEISMDITDIFAFQVANCYVGVNAALSPTTGYAYQFQAPSTNLSEDIIIGNDCITAGRVRFVGSAGGRSYNARIQGLFIGVPGTAVAIENNAANITVDASFKGCTAGTGIGVLGSNNNSGIIARGDVDSTYTNGSVLNGASGVNCVLGPWNGPSIGDIVGAGRATILYLGIPVHSAAIANLKSTYNTNNLTGAFIVGAAIATLAVAGARGETGWIRLHLGYTGGAATQTVQIVPPAGMVIKAIGVGYSAANQQLGVAAGLLDVMVEYYCTADYGGNLVINNLAGNTITLANQCWVGVEKNWG